MKTNESITAAPQVEDASAILAQGAVGTMEELWRLMTTPSLERSSFVSTHGHLVITGDAASITITA